MSISATMVNELRKRTGVGMMECKKALISTNGDIEKAIEEMRKAGQAKADKKADRTAAEGIVVVKLNDSDTKGVMIEINSETDFVARDTNFTGFADKVAAVALQGNQQDITSLSSAIMGPNGETVEQARQALIVKLGENIKLRRLIMIQNPNGVIGGYIHGSRIGVLVNVNSKDEKLAKDLAMHIAASRPLVVKREDVDQTIIDKEREIFTAQAQESGKPAEIIEKMIGGRISKFLDEVSLVGQAFVKNPDLKVEQLLKQHNTNVVEFVRYEVGEGIEKKEDNFVAEVMAQVREAE